MARHALLRDGLVALLATGIELALLLDDGEATAAAVVLTVLAGAALVVRRREPLAVLGAVLVAAAALVALEQPPSGLVVLVALFTVADTCDRRDSLVALVPTVAAAVVLSVAASGDRPVLRGATSAVLAAGVWGLGAYAQARRRERDQALRIAVHEERAAIARELHDIVAHSVSVMLLGVRGARDVLPTDPGVADDTLARVEAGGERSLAELRRALAVLRDRDAPAEMRPQPSLAELEDLVAGYREAGLPAELSVAGPVRPMAEGVELSLYRIVQEALTNALKHARPTRVDVSVAFAARWVDVEVVDDGGGGTGAGGPEHGHGLVGMRERVGLLGGELEAGRRNGGYRVAARLPA
jgi:signal transduction histidine kinase